MHSEKWLTHTQQGWLFLKSNLLSDIKSGVDDPHLSGGTVCFSSQPLLLKVCGYYRHTQVRKTLYAVATRAGP